MTYEELVGKAREVFGKADASAITEHVAYQFNITGEGEGAFYLEISDGEIRVEPYEYYDRDVIFTTTAETLIKIGLGEMDAIWAVTTGKLMMEGNIDKALLLKDLSSSIKENIKNVGSSKSAAAEKTESADKAETAEKKDVEEKDVAKSEQPVKTWPNRKKKRK